MGKIFPRLWNGKIFLPVQKVLHSLVMIPMSTGYDAGFKAGRHESPGGAAYEWAYTCGSAISGEIQQEKIEQDWMANATELS